jgi:Zn-dependent protease with chaperone function
MTQRHRWGGRRIQSSSLTALLPIGAIAPVTALALAVVWWPVHLFWHVAYWQFALLYLAAVVLLFLRPVQALVLAPLLGAQTPNPDEHRILEQAWRPVAHANNIAADDYVLRVLPSLELNAFACGGHLVVVTSFAIETLRGEELTGVLAHELSHHLGLHTVALTVEHWLSIPVLLLARVGFFLQNVAHAATDSFVSHSSALSAVGRVVAGLLTAISWVFLAGLVLNRMIGNRVSRSAEFEADERVVQMGFGLPLAAALRRVAGSRPGIGVRRDGTLDIPRPPTTFWERLAVSHPPARTRMARIEALLRR